MEEFHPRAEEAWQRFVREVEAARQEITDAPEGLRTGIAIAHIFGTLTPSVVEAIGAYGCTLAIDADARVLADRDYHAHP